MFGSDHGPIDDSDMTLTPAALLAEQDNAFFVLEQIDVEEPQLANALDFLQQTALA
jgi:hypothetical protein